MSFELQQITQLQNKLHELQQRVDVELDGLRRELRAKVRENEATLAALLDVLSDAGQLDRGELAARIRAAAIEHSHDEKDAARADQDVWDSLKGK